MPALPTELAFVSEFVYLKGDDLNLSGFMYDEKEGYFFAKDLGTVTAETLDEYSTADNTYIKDDLLDTLDNSAVDEVDIDLEANIIVNKSKHLLVGFHLPIESVDLQIADLTHKIAPIIETSLRED